MMIENFGDMKPFKIPLKEFQKSTGIYIQQRKYFLMQETFYLPSSMTTCKHYSKEDSYMKCRVKNSVYYFESMANSTNSGCRCIPNNTYKSFFEIQPTSLEWDECKISFEPPFEHTICTIHMIIDQDLLASKCPKPCEKVDYTGDFYGLNGGYHLLNANEVGMVIFSAPTLVNK